MIQIQQLEEKTQLEFFPMLMFTVDVAVTGCFRYDLGEINVKTAGNV